ncbi:MAG: hypothetical protein MJ252_18055 [archaeon]|nr:hypothetical protein [archaeon]
MKKEKKQKFNMVYNKPKVSVTPVERSIISLYNKSSIRYRKYMEDQKRKFYTNLRNVPRLEEIIDALNVPKKKRTASDLKRIVEYIANKIE